MARKYRKSRRAELEDETKRRITRALVDLHGSVGPARTTIQAVAKKARVQRATVYRHFPDEPAMFAACSARWADDNAFPDLATWATLARPERRSRRALGEIYGFYADNERMLANIFRDETLVPALSPALQGFRDYLEAAEHVIASGAGEQKPPSPVVRAAIAHALSFSTWFSLTRQNRLSRETAVALMAGMIKQASRV